MVIPILMQLFLLVTDKIFFCLQMELYNRNKASLTSCQEMPQLQINSQFALNNEFISFLASGDFENSCKGYQWTIKVFASKKELTMYIIILFECRILHTGYYMAEVCL